MFGFFLGKDVRKILKRKDSDAGERGKSLSFFSPISFTFISNDFPHFVFEKICKGKTFLADVLFLIS